jgi:pilus assembly protein CpaE
VLPAPLPAANNGRRVIQRVEIHAFTTGADAKTALESALADRRLTKVRPAYFAGSMELAARKYEGEGSPQLLIVETEDPAPAIFNQLDRLSEVCRPGTDLILLGRHNDVALYRQLAKRGVHEYIPLPADPAHLVDAVLTVCADPHDAKQARLISFIGASGGAGSTTVANNVAWRLGKLHDGEVALVDLDLAFGTVGLDFNLESPQTSAHALAQADRLDSQMLERFLVKHNENLALLTSPADCNNPAEIDIGALDQLLKTLRRNATWVVVDLPRTWTGWVRHVLEASDEIVLTAAPSLASLRNAKAAADILNGDQKQNSRVRVVLNRAGANPKSEIPVRDFSKTLGAAPAIVVPYEPALFAQAANLGQLAGETRKGQRVLEPFNKLAGLVSGRAEKRKPRRSASMIGKLMSWAM